MNINVLELGASSLLDFDWNDKRDIDKDGQFVVTKSKNTKDPKFADKVVLLNTLRSSELTLRQEVFNKDAIIFSVGDKGPRLLFEDYDIAHALHGIKTNFTLNAELLSKVINIIKPKMKKVKLIYLGSVSAAEDATYPNHAIYAAMKSAMKSLWATVKEENKDNPNMDFIYMELPQLQSRMSEGGQDPKSFRSGFLKVVDGTAWNHLSKM